MVAAKSAVISDQRVKVVVCQAVLLVVLLHGSSAGQRRGDEAMKR